MPYKDILYDRSEQIAVVTLNRPERYNAFTARMGDEIRAALKEADADDRVRVVVVTGAGKAFGAGADMEVLRSHSQQADPQGMVFTGPEPGQDLDFGGLSSFMLGLRKPVIGAINGACVGIHFVVALYFDLRVAAESARMGIIFPQRGLTIEDGASWMLPRLIGLGRAMDLALTGRLVPAREALEMGLVTRVVPDDQIMNQALELAGFIAKKCAPLSVARVKRLVYQHLFTDLATAIANDDVATKDALHSEDFKEGVKAFIEKREPNWKGR